MGEYLTLEEFKLRARIESEDGTDDDFIQKCLDAASRAVDDFTHRDAGSFAVDGDAAAIRYFEHGGEELWIDQCVSVNAVAVSEDFGVTFTALAVDTDYWLSDGLHYDRTPYAMLVINPNGSWSFFPSGRRAVKVTAVWGYSAQAPEPVKEAVTILTRNLYQGRDGTGDEDRTIVTGEGFIMPARAIPERVRGLLAIYTGGRNL